jgi:hypothetical protein
MTTRPHVAQYQIRPTAACPAFHVNAISAGLSSRDGLDRDLLAFRRRLDALQQRSDSLGQLCFALRFVVLEPAHLKPNRCALRLRIPRIRAQAPALKIAAEPRQRPVVRRIDRDPLPTDHLLLQSCAFDKIYIASCRRGA